MCECSDGSDLSDDEDGSVYSDDASKSQSRNGLLDGATPLLKEIKSLKDETAKIREEKDDLQRKADFLTAKLIEIDQKIEFLEIRANRLPSKCPANAVSTANPPPANPPPASSPSTNPPPESFEGEEKVTTANESAAPNKSVNKEPSQKAWFNVCKNFNTGTCQRNSCRYEHKKAPMCKFFNSPTGCTKGLNCNFLHIKRRKEENKPGSSKTMKPNEDQKEIPKLDSSLESFLGNLMEARLTKVIQPWLSQTAATNQASNPSQQNQQLPDIIPAQEQVVQPLFQRPYMALQHGPNPYYQ